jgi:hypothetical protein
MVDIRKYKNEMWLLFMKEPVNIENSMYPVGKTELK